MATFLLIHGAWHGAWCWERLVPLLRNRGHEVAALDLPAHGLDRSGAWRASLGGYASRVRVVAEQLDQPPVLVGHSMGGFVGTQAAHDAPQLFAALYFLCAFAPLPGDRMIDLVRQDPASQIPRHVRYRPTAVRFDPAGAAETFCGACPAEVARDAAARLRPEPLRPLYQRIRAHAPLALPRAYVFCTRDRALGHDHQRAMAERAGIERSASLDTDHSPFLSMPEALADALCGLAEAD